MNDEAFEKWWESLPFAAEEHPDKWRMLSEYVLIRNANARIIWTAALASQEQRAAVPVDLPAVRRLIDAAVTVSARLGTVIGWDGVDLICSIEDARREIGLVERERKEG